MFLDSHQIPEAHNASADLCIIGGGAAGITTALEFLNKQHSVILIESGGLNEDESTQALYDGQRVGVPYAPLHTCRSRFFGGSTNSWAGWCRPLDTLDFQHRPWVDESGWPFSRDELTSYYGAAQSRLKLGPFDYDTASWEKRLARSKASFLELPIGPIENVVNQLSPPARFGQLYRSTLASASNIRVFLHANAIELEPTPNGKSVQKVHVATLNGNRFSVEARIIVVAAGGIENARLLLASRRVHRTGLGNENGLVGRYFMDHPRVRSVPVRLPARCDRRLYDHSLALVRQRLKVSHLPIALHFAPTEQTQRELKVGNSRTYLVASSFEHLSEARMSIEQLLSSIRRSTRGSNSADLFRAATRMARASSPAALAITEFLFNLQFRRSEYYLETVIEPVPQSASRITLIPEKDRLGMNKVQLDWRLSDADKHNFLTSVRAVLAEMQGQGFEVPAEPETDLTEFWPSQVQWCWHHMGTTRMHADHAKGVVDADCRIHGLANVFVAGSSVFPTAGSDTPTLTIVALAIRMSRRIERDLAGSER
jgi:choline dehydrogenase-like flavoprotein